MKSSLFYARSTALVLAMLVLGACASKPSYDVDHSDSFDFASLKSYHWYDDVHPSQEADYRQYNSSDKRVRTYVDRELKSKGFRESASSQADFWVNYHISKQDQMRIDSFSGYPQGVHGGAGVGTYGAGVSIGYSSGPNVKHYQDGTVVLDVIDTRSQKIVWRGIAEGRLKDSLEQKDKNRIAAEVSRELLGQFPPAPAATPN
ncbi:DUF4136 domain-containing protein [Parahaliea aestuarii]|uniref:DUF4136 domain-containing protein n=1 Tax=Parahaliea aestuarii TaxID=1852021 RepID=A0A5C8ZNQ4_9GAMM|nr:DUF4136 domain-containing protein [Parahaliea aestuarii]TXS89197.1 DUF4136 domain-containing protein [Parahaliea aestuarii]